MPEMIIPLCEQQDSTKRLVPKLAFFVTEYIALLFTTPNIIL